MSPSRINETPSPAGLRPSRTSPRGLAAVAAAGFGVLCLAPPAQAAGDPQACADLRGQLAGLSASRDGGEIDALRARIAAAGCTGFSLRQRPTDTVRAGSAAAPVIQVQAQQEGERPDKFFKKLFPFFFKKDEAPPAAAPQGRPRVLAPQRSGPAKPATVAAPHTPAKPDAKVESFRTYCVRSCDGYYYQIGRATQSGDFARDQSACNNSCPSSQTELFVMRNNDPKATELTSLSGVPYSRTATAFRFRTETTAACTCSGSGAGAGPAPALSTAGGTAATPAAPQQAADTTSAPARATTAAAPATAAPAAQPVVSKPPLRVRSVGPAYLQAQ